MHPSGMSLLRIGLVVPNLTLQTEIPTMLLRHAVNFSFRVGREVFADCDVAVVVPDTPEMAVAPQIPVIGATSALVAGLASLGAARVAMVTSAAPVRTAGLVTRLADVGIGVVDAISLGVADEDDAARLAPSRLVGLASRLALEGADAVVLAPCGRMPTLSMIEELEHRFGLPVVSAATAVVRSILDELELEHAIPGCGALLRG